LRHVVRQQEESGILWNATRLRQLIEDEEYFCLPKIRFSGFADVKNVPGNELIETISDCYSHCGTDETMVVCRSNKRAHVYNNGIRNQILGREEELSSGDLLLIAKNNYFWMRPDGSDDKDDSEDASTVKNMIPTDFIANGDVAVVERVRNVRELYGFRFADCWLRLPDYDDYELEATVLLDTLHSESPALSREDNERLFNNIMEDYMDIPNKRERMKKMKEDPYFNALQIKYAYAVTCHKAQGGQWQRVFVDQGYMTEDMLGPDYFRWLYTALTRATETVYFVNWREEQTLECE
jgi:exodeoxyribonuclease-5